jgi:hypothetical protein
MWCDFCARAAIFFAVCVGLTMVLVGTAGVAFGW